MFSNKNKKNVRPDKKTCEKCESREICIASTGESGYVCHKIKNGDGK